MRLSQPLRGNGTNFPCRRPVAQGRTDSRLLEVDQLRIERERPWRGPSRAGRKLRDGAMFEGPRLASVPGEAETADLEGQGVDQDECGLAKRL